jgi:hypothetical protein
MALQGQCRVYIGFSDGPLVASPTWTEVTSWVREVSTNRGRSNELDDFQAGTAQVVLDNRDRRFDPDYASSPYTGNIKVRRQIKIEGVYSGVTYPIFRGVIQSWQQQYHIAGRDATTVVQAADLFNILATWDLPLTAHEAAVRALSPTAFWALDDSDDTMRDRYQVANGVYGSQRESVAALETGGQGASRHHAEIYKATTSTIGTFGPVSTTSTNITSIVAIVKLNGFDAYQTGFIAYDDAVVFVRVASSGSEQIELCVDSFRQPTLIYGSTQVSAANAGLNEETVYHLAVVRNGANATVYLNGTSVATSTTLSTGSWAIASGTIGRGPSGTDLISGIGRFHEMFMDEVAIWQGTALTGTQVSNISAAVAGWVSDTADGRINRVLTLLGVPAGLISLGAASSSVGKFEGDTDALSYLLSVARSDQGRLFVNRSGVITFQPKTTDMGASAVVTFADDATASSVRYNGFAFDYDDRLIYNNIETIGTEDARASVINSTSQATYSIRSLTVDTELPSASACRDVSEKLVSRYADPQTRGRQWTCHPERPLWGSATLGYASVLGRELGDIVSVKRTPPVGSTITKTVQITSISHDINIPEGSWNVTFGGSPAYTTAAFRWGTSNWGGSDGWS